MPTVTIPATIEDAVSALGGLGALLTAKEWERAAIVWAFTKPEGERHNSLQSTSALKTAKEFAALGITGLKSDTSVCTYRKVWQDAIDSGDARSARPGRPVKLPGLDWPRTANGGGLSHDVHGDADQKAAAVVTLMKDPKVSRKVLADRDQPVRKAARKADHEDWAKEDRARQRRRTKYEQEFPDARRIRERGEETVVVHELAKAIMCLNTVIKALPECGPMDVDVDLDSILARVEAIRAFTTGGGIAVIEAFANEARA